MPSVRRGPLAPPAPPADPAFAAPALADEPSPIPGISRNVFLLALVSFWNDVASEMLYPVIPIFLASTLGAPYSAVGLVEGSAEAVASVLKGASGWLADRVGRRKPLVGLGYLLSAVAKPLLGLAS